MNRFLLFLVSVTLSLLISCSYNERKVDTYENIKKSLKGVENEKIIPHAAPEQFEAELNNGGLNQYLFNASGQNCFETLRYFKNHGRTEEAKILEEAIKLINPNNLSEGDLIEKLRNRLVNELEDSTVNSKLDSLDQLYYR